MKNGVTLLVLVVAISVMFVIISSASVIGINSINQANYEEYKSMIKRVSDDINSYYLTNKELPINNEIISVDSLGMDFSNNVKNNKDENDTFYIVNIDKLNNQTITNGRGTLQNRDIFLIAKNSNNLYYLKGFNFNGKINYSLRNEENVASATADTIEKYVKTGLILHYDGINNIRTSPHSNTTNVWKDLSGNGNDGSLLNFNYNTNSGWLNNGLKFDGSNDYIMLNSFPTIVDNDFTFESRIKLLTTPVSTDDGLFSINDLAAGSNGVYIWIGTLNNLHIVIKGSNGIFNQSYYFMSLNNVYNITISYKKENSNGIKIYSNGTLLYTRSSIGIGTISNTIPMVIGTRLSSNSTVCLNFDVNFLRWYNRELTLSEITQNYQVDVERFGI